MIGILDIMVWSLPGLWTAVANAAGAMTRRGRDGRSRDDDS